MKHDLLQLSYAASGNLPTWTWTSKLMTFWKVAGEMEHRRGLGLESPDLGPCCWIVTNANWKKVLGLGVCWNHPSEDWPLKFTGADFSISADSIKFKRWSQSALQIRGLGKGTRHAHQRWKSRGTMSMTANSYSVVLTL